MASTGSGAVFLVDTSVWIQTFRTAPRIRIEDALDFDDIVTCLPVVQEVLQGFRDDRAYAVARESMRSLPLVESPLSISVVDDAVGLYRQRDGPASRFGQVSIA